MRAKLVNENIQFDRGIDPRKKMDVGMSAVWKKIVDETSWALALDPIVHEVEYVEEDYMGHPIMVVKLKDPILNKEYPYSGVSDFPGGFSTLHHSVKSSIEGIKEKIRKRELKYESINFERGRDPKTSMDIGVLSNAQWDYEVDGFETEDYIYKGYPIRVVGKNWTDHSPYPEYTAFTANVNSRGLSYRLKWYKRRGDAKRYIQRIIDNIIEIRNIVKEVKSKRQNESVNFERGKDPRDKMGIGKKAALKQEASKIDWDWYPDPRELMDEEIIWLKKIYGINVKVARLPNADSYNPDDEEYVDDVYYAISDSGEPYMDAPTFFKTPREALDWEKEYIKELIDPPIDASDHEIII